MKRARFVLLYALCWVPFGPPWRSAEAAGSEPRPEQIQALRKRIAALRAANDVDGLRRCVTEARAEWLPSRNAEYGPVILELCLALNSTAPADPEVRDAIRDLAVSVIDSPQETPARIKGKLCLLLRGDPEYSHGQLKGEAWIKERRERTDRWFKVWKSIREELAALPEPGPFSMYPAPPPGVLDGADPSSVKDPVLRKQYEEAFEKNTRNANAYRRKHDLVDSEKQFASDAKQNFIEAYSKPPFRTDELDKSLRDNGIADADRDAILAEVKKREAAYAEREAHTPPPPHMEITQPAPPGDTPVHADPRLRTPLSFDLKAPLVDDLLRELHKATGVDLSRADGIQNQAPAFGSLSLRGVPAWQVMDDVAASHHVEGRWEADGAGYRLVPNGKAVDLTGEAPHRSPPVPEEWGPFRTFLMAANLVLLAVALVVVLWRVSRDKGGPQPPAADSVGK